MNGLPTNGVWGYAPAGGRQVAVGVWGYAGLGTRQPAAVTEAMKQFNQILRPKRAPQAAKEPALSAINCSHYCPSQPLSH